jgi:hypothetical protein
MPGDAMMNKAANDGPQRDGGGDRSMDLGAEGDDPFVLFTEWASLADSEGYASLSSTNEDAA